jgi:polyisoprenoid-binding protein YceI
MKKYFVILCFFGTVKFCSAQIYLAKSCTISFFSSSVIEDIDATNEAAKPVMNTATGEVVIKVPVRSFKFHSQLMQDHFNEDYLETDKYPFAVFTGKINETIDYSKDTVNSVTVTGKMNMHGVEKPVTVPGTITVNHGSITINSKFNVRLADYNITVQALYVKNIAEEVEVKITSELEPYKKD